MPDIQDLDHLWSQDLLTASTGDIHTVSGATRSQQRVIRRLLTNPLDANGPPDYPLHPTYGAGLSRHVGRATGPAELRALIRGQMLMEDSVARNPEPQITVTRPDPSTISVYIRYTIASTGAPATLSFSVNA